MLGEERVDVEILDPVASIDVVGRSPLAERDTEDTIGIRPPTGPASKAGVLIVPRDRGQAFEVFGRKPLVTPVLASQGAFRKDPAGPGCQPRPGAVRSRGNVVLSVGSASDRNQASRAGIRDDTVALSGGRAPTVNNHRPLFPQDSAVT
jgi:hypothetical protein